MPVSRHHNNIGLEIRQLRSRLRRLEADRLDYGQTVFPGRLLDRRFPGDTSPSRRPVRLVHQEAFDTQGEAMRREIQLKKLSRSAKLALIARA